MLIGFLSKKPVWVTLLVVIVVSWFGAPIGFMYLHVNYAIPAVQTMVTELEEKHKVERSVIAQEQKERLMMVTEAFDKALDRQENASDKTISLLERLTSRIEHLTNVKSNGGD